MGRYLLRIHIEFNVGSLGNFTPIIVKCYGDDRFFGFRYSKQPFVGHKHESDNF